jgi:hypothetical protein
MNLSGERRQSLRELKAALGHDGRQVELEIVEYEPGRRGLPPPWSQETVAIYIGIALSQDLLAAMVADAWETAKEWASRRYHRKRKSAEDAGSDPDKVPGETFTIYGPDNKPLKTWTIDKDGEHNDDQ